MADTFTTNGYFIKAGAATITAREHINWDLLDEVLAGTSSAASLVVSGNLDAASMRVGGTLGTRTGTVHVFNGTSFHPYTSAVVNAAVALKGSFGGAILLDDTGLSGIWSLSTGTQLHFGTGGNSSSGIYPGMILYTTGFQLTQSTLWGSGVTTDTFKVLQHPSDLPYGPGIYFWGSSAAGLGRCDFSSCTQGSAGDYAHRFQNFDGSTYDPLMDLFDSGVINTYGPTIQLGLNLSATFNCMLGTNIGAYDVRVEMGSDRTGDGNTYIDLHAASGSGDYDLRIMRWSGTNGATEITHKGTGYFTIGTENAIRLNIKTNNTIRWYINSVGNEFSPAAYTTSVTGKPCYIRSDGCIGYYSSARKYKKNIKPLADWQWIFNAEPVRYQRKETDETELGFIADDLEELAPEVVFHDDGNEVDGLHHIQLIAPIVAALKSLNSRITSLEKQS